MSSTTIKWQAFGPEDPWAKLAEPQTTILAGKWPETCGEDAVQDICANYFEHDFDWEGYCGDDDETAVLVVVSEPKTIAGAYIVNLRRTINAVAQHVDDPRPNGGRINE